MRVPYFFSTEQKNKKKTISTSSNVTFDAGVDTPHLYWRWPIKIFLKLTFCSEHNLLFKKRINGYKMP